MPDKTKAELIAENEVMARKLEDFEKQFAGNIPSPNGVEPTGAIADPVPITVSGAGQEASQQGMLPGARTEAFPAAAGPMGEQLKSQTAVRWYRSETERLHATKRQGSHRFPHAAPFSVLVGTVGNSWKGDSWGRVMNMCDFAHAQGISITFQEFQDRNFEPYDALGTMRNEIFARAIGGGYEFCLMIDNDVRPQEDTLYRLINRDLPLVSPFIEEPVTSENKQTARRVLHGPFRESYMGMYNVSWNVLTMMLWKTNFINALGDQFWGDSIGGDEGYHFQRMYAKTGVYPVVDSDVVLEAGGSPLYPLTVKKSGDWDKPGGVKDQRIAKFNSIPERGPLIQGDPRVTPEGVYLPFMQPPQPEPASNEEPTQEDTNDPAQQQPVSQ